MTRRAAPLMLPEPRGLTADVAAAYVGASSVEMFESEVAKGIWPPAIAQTSDRRRQRWDRKALDRAFDSYSGLTDHSRRIGGPGSVSDITADATDAADLDSGLGITVETQNAGAAAPRHRKEARGR